MVLDVKIDQVIAEKIKVKHQSVFFETPGISFRICCCHCLWSPHFRSTFPNTSEQLCEHNLIVPHQRANAIICAKLHNCQNKKQCSADNQKESKCRTILQTKISLKMFVLMFTLDTKPSQNLFCPWLAKTEISQQDSFAMILFVFTMFAGMWQ